jgi:hypothetical protein
VDVKADTGLSRYCLCSELEKREGLTSHVKPLDIELGVELETLELNVQP